MLPTLLAFYKTLLMYTTFRYRPMRPRNCFWMAILLGVKHHNLLRLLRVKYNNLRIILRTKRADIGASRGADISIRKRAGNRASNHCPRPRERYEDRRPRLLRRYHGSCEVDFRVYR